MRPDREATQVGGRRRAVVGAVGLVAVAVTNVVQFPAIERHADAVYAAIPPYSARDLPTLVSEHYGATQRLFGVHVTLAAEAPGASLVADPAVPLSEADLVGLGRIDDVERQTVPIPGEATRREIEDHVAASGEHTSGPWTLSLAEGRPEQLVAYLDAGTIRLVDRRLLDR